MVNHLYDSAQAKGTLKDPLGGVADPTGSPSQPHPPHSSSQQPATLFSNSQIRGEVATQVGMACMLCVGVATSHVTLLFCVQVLIGSHDLGEGFEIAREIIEVSHPVADEKV